MGNPHYGLYRYVLLNRVHAFCLSGSDCLTLEQNMKITLYVWKRDRLILPHFDSGTGSVFSLWCLIIPNQAYMYIGAKLHFPCFSSLSQPYEQAFYFYNIIVWNRVANSSGKGPECQWLNRPHKKKKWDHSLPVPRH